MVVSDNNGQYFTQSGEFDPRTNEFFWASTDRDGKFQLYTINLENGKVTPVGGYSTEASLMALTFPKTPTAPAAPAAVANKHEFKLRSDNIINIKNLLFSFFHSLFIS